MILGGLIAFFNFERDFADLFYFISGFVILVGIAIIRWKKKIAPSARIIHDKDEPLSVLKMRLAKGEITKEEFDKIKEDLK